MVRRDRHGWILALTQPVILYGIAHSTTAPAATRKGRNAQLLVRRNWRRSSRSLTTRIEMVSRISSTRPSCADSMPFSRLPLVLFLHHLCHGGIFLRLLFLLVACGSRGVVLMGSNSQVPPDCACGALPNLFGLL